MEYIGLTNPLLSPEYLMPQFYGVEWGDSHARCAEILHASVIFENPWNLRVRKEASAEIIEAILRFEEEEGLWWIYIDLASTQSFWERDEATVQLQSELLIQYEADYHEFVNQYKALLGEPSFSGNWDAPDYPEGELATPLTIWSLREGTFRVEFDHSDKELPIVLRLSARPPVTAVPYVPQSLNEGVG
jgi:hypothetical protein